MKNQNKSNLRTFIQRVNETVEMTYRTHARDASEALRLFESQQCAIDSKIITAREYGEIEEITGE